MVTLRRPGGGLLLLFLASAGCWLLSTVLGGETPPAESLSSAAPSQQKEAAPAVSASQSTCASSSSSTTVDDAGHTKTAPVSNPDAAGVTAAPLYPNLIDFLQQAVFGQQQQQPDTRSATSPRRSSSLSSSSSQPDSSSQPPDAHHPTFFSPAEPSSSSSSKPASDDTAGVGNPPIDLNQLVKNVLKSSLLNWITPPPPLSSGAKEEEGSGASHHEEESPARDDSATLSAWQALMEAAMARSSSKSASASPWSAFMDTEQWPEIQHNTRLVAEQLQANFQQVPLWERFHPIQIWYYFFYEEAFKDAVWKRRAHRLFQHDRLALDQALALADGLFLSQLAYVDSCADMARYAHEFHGGSWALLNCSSTGQPHQPAHLVMVQRHAEPLDPSHRDRENYLKEEEQDPWWKRLLPRKVHRHRQRFVSPGRTSNSSSSASPLSQDEDVLDVVIVVRGTKEPADIISDGLLQAVDYRGRGWAHDGVLRSALWLVDTYQPLLLELLQHSQRSHIQLWLVGHSLGGGAAALAAMEFNIRQQEAEGITNDDEMDNGTTNKAERPRLKLQAHALGFGTPAVLSEELSKSLRDTVTTVVHDADCVPRLSGATLVNAWWKIQAHNFTDAVMDDVDLILPLLRIQVEQWQEQWGFAARMLSNFLNLDKAKEEDSNNWVEEWLTRLVLALKDHLKQDISKHLAAGGNESNVPQVPVVLFPPGDCIHLYRDGTGWQGTYTPCTWFTELEVVLHMVEDHLIPPGYYTGLLQYVRQETRNPHYRFQPDLLDLPVV